jgi:hypothetical protein
MLPGPIWPQHGEEIANGPSSAMKPKNKSPATQDPAAMDEPRWTQSPWPCLLHRRQINKDAGQAPWAMRRTTACKELRRDAWIFMTMIDDHQAILQFLCRSRPDQCRINYLEYMSSSDRNPKLI